MIKSERLGYKALGHVHGTMIILSWNDLNESTKRA